LYCISRLAEFVFF